MRCISIGLMALLAILLIVDVDFVHQTNPFAAVLEFLAVIIIVAVSLMLMGHLEVSKYDAGDH